VAGNAKADPTGRVGVVNAVFVVELEVDWVDVTELDDEE
jgi:hypothetical protein